MTVGLPDNGPWPACKQRKQVHAIDQVLFRLFHPRTSVTKYALNFGIKLSICKIEVRAIVLIKDEINQQKIRTTKVVVVLNEVDKMK